MLCTIPTLDGKFVLQGMTPSLLTIPIPTSTYDVMTCYVCFPAQSAVRDIAIGRNLGLRFLILLNLILYGCLNRLEFLASFFQRCHPSLLQNPNL